MRRQQRPWWRARYLALAIWGLIFPTREEVIPKSIGLELLDAENMAKSGGFSILLYRNGKAVWRQGRDLAGEIDVAAIEIDRSVLPEPTVHRAFNPAHVLNALEHIEIGASLLVAGFPLGFHDTLHHTPVTRQAVLASSFALRFQGQGYFLTEARTHRGTSGAPVAMRASEGASKQDALPWRQLGAHSSRLNVGTRDLNLDEAFGLNCTWYADILLTLTAT